MHANSRMVSLHHILQRVARVDSQSLANLSWNSRLPLSRYRGMLNQGLLTLLSIPYMAIIPYFRLAGKSKRWPRSVSDTPRTSVHLSTFRRFHETAQEE